MHPPQLFTDLIIIILASLPTAYACVRLKLPLLVGLIVTGVVIGPYGFGFVGDLEGIELLAEIGVMLLLFVIGLEFSIRKLIEMKRLVLIGGSMQVVITIGLTALIVNMFGREMAQAIFFGFLIALSSTAIVLKEYFERNAIDSPHGQIVTAILIFQDIAVVLMLLVLPILSGEGDLPVSDLILKLVVSLSLIVAMVAAAWFIVPRSLKTIVRLRTPEVFLLTIVLLALGMAWITANLGMSMAMGSFMAGVVLAGSEYRHQAMADILPFRDVFNSLFFVSIGTLLSISSMYQNIGSVILVVVGLIVMKALIVWGVVRLLRYPQRIAVLSAIALAQVGEFSFVLAKSGRDAGLLPDADYQTFLAASILSMIATPFLIGWSPRIARSAQRLFTDGRSKDLDNSETDDIHMTSSGGLAGHVIIVGYGLNGRNLARVLRAVGVPFLILDLNAETVRRAKANGEKINFGDATRAEVLRHAGIDLAKALVLAMSDAPAARMTASQARKLNNDIHIIVRTRYVSEIGELLTLGADEVIPEEFETSIEIFARVLRRYGFAWNVIDEQIDRVRQQQYQMLRSTSTPPEPPSDMDVALKSDSTESVQVERGSRIAGRDLGSLDVRGRSGATIIAVVRNGETKISPGADFTIEAGDLLVLLGGRTALDKGVRLLKEHPEETL